MRSSEQNSEESELQDSAMEDLMEGVNTDGPMKSCHWRWAA